MTNKKTLSMTIKTGINNSYSEIKKNKKQKLRKLQDQSTLLSRRNNNKLQIRVPFRIVTKQKEPTLSLERLTKALENTTFGIK